MCLAIPGIVMNIDEGDPVNRRGKVSFAGVVKDICLTYVPEATVGSYVIVHAGFAISTLKDEEAQSVFSYLDEIEVPQE